MYSCVPDEEIIEMIHIGMKRILEKCEEYEKTLSSFNFSSLAYQKYKNTGLTIIEECKSQLEIHMNLENTTLGEHNFYKVFKSLFENGSYNKGVDFYIKEIIDDVEGEKRLIEDEKLLNKEFTINYCMPCMDLVPHQLASNAKKYCMSYQNVEILLVKDVQYNTNTIYVSNIGPHCTDEEINKLVEEGVSGNSIRGNNAKDVAGMGIGLSEVKEIIKLHEDILETSFDISTDNKIIATIEDKPYSIFTTIFSYSTKPSDTSRIKFPKSFREKIPMILLHNSVDIIATLIEATKRVNKIKYKGSDHLKDVTNMFLIEIEKFQDLTKFCLYLRNNFSTDNLLGNFCNINLGDNIKSLVKYICLNDYPNLVRNSTIEIRGETDTYEFYSCLYPCLYGFFDNILYQLESEYKLLIEIDEDSFTLTCEDFDFRDIIVTEIPLNWIEEEKPEERDYESVRLKFYYDVFCANEIYINIINPNKVSFKFI